MNKQFRFVRPVSLKRAAAVAGTAVATLASYPAIAQTSGGFDVSGGVAAIENAGTAVAAIGLAAFVVLIAIKVWKWIRSAA